jgi:hypothetical protein
MKRVPVGSLNGPSLLLLQCQNQKVLGGVAELRNKMLLTGRLLHPGRLLKLRDLF